MGQGAEAQSADMIAIGTEAGVGSATTNIESVAVGTNAGNDVTGSFNTAYGARAGSNVTATSTRRAAPTPVTPSLAQAIPVSARAPDPT